MTNFSSSGSPYNRRFSFLTWLVVMIVRFERSIIAANDVAQCALLPDDWAEKGETTLYRYCRMSASIVYLVAET